MNHLHLALTRGAFRLKVDVRLPASGVTALFGPSGSGKTTVLRAIAGFERAAGRVSFNGGCWQDDEQRIFVPTHQRPIGYVFQEASLFPHLTVRGNLEYGFKRLPPAQRRVTLNDVVGWLGLEKLIERQPSGLSGGERQRVAIGRALLTSPQLLLMDEPLSALDEASKSEILPYLEQLHRNLSIPVIYVSHSVQEVARLADHIVQLDGGLVVAQGSALPLLTQLNRPQVVGEEPGAVIEATIASHDHTHYLTTLTLPGGLTLLAPLLTGEVGAVVRVRIPAREISLALTAPQGSSILNILPAKIIECSDADPGRLLVLLEVAGTTRLLSRISLLSWQRLNLAPGQMVQAQIKSMGLSANG